MSTTLRRPLVVGHRGARRLAIENTLEALRIAANEGADGVEFDVQLSRDGELFLFHDDDLKRLCGRDTAPTDLTWRELRALQLQAPELEPQHVAHFDEVLELLAHSALHINAEIKVDTSRGRDNGRALAEKLARALRHVDQTRWLVSSFERTPLLRLQQDGAALRLAALVERDPACAWHDLSTGAEATVDLVAVNPEWPLVDAARMGAWQARGWQVWTWTANEPYTWHALMQHGVDAMITDDPGGLRRFLEREWTT